MSCNYTCMCRLRSCGAASLRMVTCILWSGHLGSVWTGCSLSTPFSLRSRSGSPATLRKRPQERCVGSWECALEPLEKGKSANNRGHKVFAMGCYRMGTAIAHAPEGGYETPPACIHPHYLLYASQVHETFSNDSSIVVSRWQMQAICVPFIIPPDPKKLLLHCRKKKMAERCLQASYTPPSHTPAGCSGAQISTARPLRAPVWGEVMHFSGIPEQRKCVCYFADMTYWRLNLFVLVFLVFHVGIHSFHSWVLTTTCSA